MKPLAEVVDPATRAYINGVSSAFEDLQLVACRLSEWASIRSRHASSLTAKELAVKVARQLVHSSMEDMAGQEPPAAAMPHYEALCRAATLLDESTAVDSRRRNQLSAARSQLEAASLLLPGFVMRHSFIADEHRRKGPASR